jgi:hypothetical protein
MNGFLPKQRLLPKDRGDPTPKDIQMTDGRFSARSARFFRAVVA